MLGIMYDHDLVTHNCLVNNPKLLVSGRAYNDIDERRRQLRGIPTTRQKFSNLGMHLVRDGPVQSTLADLTSHYHIEWYRSVQATGASTGLT